MAAASFATGRRELTVVHRAMALSASCCGSSAVHGPCVGRMDIASGPRTSDSDKPPFFMSFFAFFFFFFFLAFFLPFFLPPLRPPLSGTWRGGSPGDEAAQVQPGRRSRLARRSLGLLRQAPRIPLDFEFFFFFFEFFSSSHAVRGGR